MKNLKAFLKGTRAFYKNEENPYDDFYKSREWQRGFNNAYFKNKERLNGKAKRVG